MAKTYPPKEIEIIFEQVEAKPEEVEKRISEAYAVLFEETFRFLKEQKEREFKTNDKSFKYQGLLRKGGEDHEQNIYSK